jgi:hypothetical protein
MFFISTCVVYSTLQASVVHALVDVVSLIGPQDIPLAPCSTIVPAPTLDCCPC